MRIRVPGKVCDGLWFLGREETGVYLLEGSTESVIISGGMSYIVPIVLQQMEQFGIEKAKIQKILILHSHFDHVGIIPWFKRSRPGIEIHASHRAWEILEMSNAIETVNAFSRSVAERMDAMDAYGFHDLDWRSDIRGQRVRDGDEIDIGGISIRIFETPGHSSCAIAAYVPRLKALFPSDAGGIPFQDTIVASGNSNFTRYQKSLEKLALLETDFVCADHYGYVKGDEARHFIVQSIKAAREHRRIMEACYLRTRDIDRAATEMVDAMFEKHPDYFLSREIFEGVYRQMIKHLAAMLNTDS